jgi:hypothetical protein
MLLSVGVPSDVLAQACTYAVSFHDLDDAGSLRDFVCHLSVAGMSSGYGDGTFRPLHAVTRGEAAKLLAATHMLCAAAQEMPYEDAGRSPFAPFIAQLYAMQWFRPVGERFAPALPLTRREAAQIIARVLETPRPMPGDCMTGTG